MHQTQRRIEVMADAHRLLGSETLVYYTLQNEQLTASEFSAPESFVEPAHYAPVPDDRKQPLRRFLYEHNASHAMLFKPRSLTEKLRWKDLAVPAGLHGVLHLMAQGPGWYVRYMCKEPLLSATQSWMLTEPLKEHEIIPLQSEGQSVAVFFDMTADFTTKHIKAKDKDPVLLLFYVVPKFSLAVQGEYLQQVSLVRGMTDDIDMADVEVSPTHIQEPADVDPAKVSVSLTSIEARLNQVTRSLKIKPIPNSAIDGKFRKGLTPFEYLVGHSDSPANILPMLMEYLKSPDTHDLTEVCSFTDRPMATKLSFDIKKVDWADPDIIPVVVSKLLEAVGSDAVDIAPRTAKDYFSLHPPRPTPKIENRLVASITSRWALRLHWVTVLCGCNPTSPFVVDTKYNERSALKALNPEFARSSTKMRARMSEAHRRLMVCAMIELAVLMNQRAFDKWPKMIHTFLETVPDPVAAGFLRRDNAMELIQWLVQWNATTYPVLDKLHNFSADESTKKEKKRQRALAAASSPEEPPKKKSKKKSKKHNHSDAENEDAESDTSSDKAPAKRKSSKHHHKDEAPTKKRKKNKNKTKAAADAPASVNSFPLVPLGHTTNRRLGVEPEEMDMNEYMQAWRTKLPSTRKGITISPLNATAVDVRSLFVEPLLKQLNLWSVPVQHVEETDEESQEKFVLYLVHRFDEQGVYTAVVCPFHPHNPAAPTPSDGYLGVSVISSTPMMVEAATRLSTQLKYEAYEAF